MRRSIEELRTFYGEPTGALARRLLARRLEDAWGEAANSDVLGIGYATPWLDAFVGARRVIAAMPGGQGVEPWPSVGKNRSLLVDDRRLPFAAGSFDRILLIHALEEADDAQGLMNEAVRALSPA
ncbi:MAG: type 11 methyltransferase, partial [bacterium]